ncbi:uncharacterized protein LOC111069213 isoform X2 [Drosophila obscura]|uniref:uncharacterized protein LOC111069213 isoform X2 n=1 Tax=Drosophila obscura TaxID=7282 RepID=UPI001BB1606B|nr:uncharacterized protein LOC111069213 isoform X2 [Drosophila obscura]
MNTTIVQIFKKQEDQLFSNAKNSCPHVFEAALSHIERPKHLKELNDGCINLLSNLTLFDGHAFYLQMDELHVSDLGEAGQLQYWKLFVMSAQSADGDFNRFLYVVVKPTSVGLVMGRKTMKAAILKVLDAIHAFKMNNLLLGVISDGR